MIKGVRTFVLMSLALSVMGGPLDAQVTLKIERDLWVTPTGTDVERCVAARDALDSISDSSGGRQYTVNLPAGRYDCGNETLFVPQFVTLKGSSRWATTIVGVVDENMLGVVHLAHGATLQSVTVDNLLVEGTLAGIAISIWDIAPANPQVRLIDVAASGANIAPDNYSVKALGVETLVVTRSWLEDTVDLDSASVASFAYSGLSQIQAAAGATANCFFYVGLGGTSSGIGNPCP